MPRHHLSPFLPQRARRLLLVLASALSLAACATSPIDKTRHPAAASTSPQLDPQLFIITPSHKSVDDVVNAIRNYALERKWQYLGANKVNAGQVALVKLCIPEVGQQLWPLGFELSAMFPCGNVGVYSRDGHTEISLLHPRYMTLLYAHPKVEQASQTAAPLLLDMVRAVPKN